MFDVDAVPRSAFSVARRVIAAELQQAEIVVDAALRK
jgi:hypothetical protein